MKSKNCKNCTYYTAYYKQWSSHYGRLNHGFCAKHNKPQTQFETYEAFKSNEVKEAGRYERLLADLERALKFINHIAQILKEKKHFRVKKCFYNC